MNWNTPELKNFDPKDYTYHGFWPSGVLANYFWGRWYHKYEAVKNKMPEIESGSFVFNSGGNATSLFLMNKIKDFVESKTNKEGIDFFQSVVENLDKKNEELSNKYLGENKIQKDVFLEYIEDLRKLHFYWGFGWYFSTIFEKVILKICVENGISENDMTSYAKYVPSLLAKQQEDLRKIRKMFEEKNSLNLLNSNFEEIEKSLDDFRDINEKLEEHLENFGWVEWISFTGRSMDRKKVLEQVRDIKKSNVKSRYEELSDEMKIYFDLAWQAAYLNQLGAEYMSRITFKNNYLFNDIAEELHLTQEELISLLPLEINDALTGVISQEELRKIVDHRKLNKFVSFTDKEGKYVFTDDISDSEQVGKLLTPKFDKTAEEIKGSTANKGFAKGIVKVVLSPNDFDKFKEGEILVTGMTTPDFVVLMQKSAAIVTDIGGLLSHASIVSRELEKPCIIGTKFATQILKDGDMVEVDADNGVVKILK